MHNDPRYDTECSRRDEMERRKFLKKMALASSASLMMSEPRRLFASTNNEQNTPPAATADSCILLWMGGGMAAPDTFDPKRYLPFEKGLAVEKILSTFPAIDTVVDNIKLTAGLENIARIMDRATLVRSHVQPDLGHILHSRHQYHWHTGYVPPQTVAAPHIGAWMSRVLGPNNPVIPPFINIGQQIEGNGESEELKAFTTDANGPVQSTLSFLQKTVGRKSAVRVCQRISATINVARDRQRASAAGFERQAGF